MDRTLSRRALCALLLAAPAAAQADILLSNLAEERRDASVLSEDLWAAQSFVNDGDMWTLTSIRAVVGDQTESPDIFAELRDGSVTGALLTTFTLPGFSGPESVRTFLPTDYQSRYPYPLVVLFHGHGGSEEQAARLAPRVSRRNYITISLRGPRDLGRRADGRPAFGWGADDGSEDGQGGDQLEGVAGGGHGAVPRIATDSGTRSGVACLAHTGYGGPPPSHLSSR